MQLQNYIASLDRGGVSKLALQVGVTVSFLSQMSSGYTRIPPSRALAIEIATNGRVTRRELLPNDWQRYWLKEELDFTESKRYGVEQP
ncbi:transcriptional regulator [Klebsiella aerogenes]|uniref:transcriptional regulator n=1 Tax=Klebsiella aerogenes TaxID=548 RepID=UPI001BD17FAF|nr:YdaS family helix-turn-helix protein [Klebsiella aerogenes]